MITAQESCVQTKKKNGSQNTKKAKFSPSEDTKLVRLVKIHGDSDWRLIAGLMKNRSVRQVRERWRNYLCPWVKNTPWSESEEGLLMKKVTDYGQHWVTIAKFFPGRTDINVKNHYVTLIRQKNLNGHMSSSEESSEGPSIEIPQDITQKTEQSQDSPAAEESTPLKSDPELVIWEPAATEELRWNDCQTYFDFF